MMEKKYNIVAISGSTRNVSLNLTLIKTIRKMTEEIFTIHIFDGLSDLPHFNPDMDQLRLPEKVASFKQLLNKADGILICTPEYAMGVPGTLKNAIDWTVSSMEFSKKPVALITASLSGEKAHQSLLETLLIIESKMTTDTQLLLSFIKTKISKEGQIIDASTFQSIEKLIQSLKELVTGVEEPFLSAPLLRNQGVDSGM